MKQMLAWFFCLTLIACGETETSVDENKSPENKTPETLFSLLPSSETGIDFQNLVEETHENNYFRNQYIFNGGGVAIGDINNDSLPDIYFTGNSVEDKLYLNKGNLQFEDITQSAGIDSKDDLWSTGVTMVDIDSDGWLDIYVCKAGYQASETECENKFYINKGDGTFIEMGKQLGLNDNGFSSQSSFFDFDADGDLDLYVVNYPGDWNPNYIRMQKMGKEIPFRVTDHLYENKGKGVFEERSTEAGINNLAFGLGIITADINEDGKLDIYVANDYQESDFLYINQGDGTFTQEIKKFFNHNSQSSMGIDYADFNSDTRADFFVAEMLPKNFKRSKTNMASMEPEAFYHFIEEGIHYQYMHNVLQMNTGNQFFSDISQMTKTDKTDWSWSPFFADFDNDGDRDLYVSNGIKRDMMYKDATNERKEIEKKGGKWTLEEAYNMIPSTKLANAYFENSGDFDFKEKASESGLGTKSFSNGAIYSDLDGDGDLDIVVNNIDDKAFVYRNNSDNKNFIQLEFDKPKSLNRDGINTSVYLYQGETKQIGQYIPTRGFQSATAGPIHFGVDGEAMIDSLVIVWDDYTVQWEYELEPGQLHTIVYQPETNAQRLLDPQYFEDVSNTEVLSFVHRENKYNDFKKETLLPHRQSQLGPFISKGDVNGDDLEDFYIGGAKGQPGQVYLQQEAGGFNKGRSIIGHELNKEEMGSLLFDANGDGNNDLYIVAGGNEKKAGSSDYQDRLYLNNGKGRFKISPNAIPYERNSGSCVIGLDYDNDGDTDLFVGGRAIPGKYPEADDCLLLQNNDGKFTNVIDSVAPKLKNIGIVTDAVWVKNPAINMNQLMITGEWMSIHTFIFDGNTFKESNVGFKTKDYTGWYYSITPCDYNNDGIPDLLVGAIGENHKFSPTAENPFKIYYDDFDGNGTNDIVLAQHVEEGNGYFPVRGKQCLSEQMPFISEEKFNDYEEFSDSNIQDIFGNALNEAKISKDAKNFSSLILLGNSSGTYTIEKLPSMAQIAPINAALTADFNQDNKKDILIGGNLFETEVETSRADAGFGLLFNQNEIITNSGLFIPGDVKDMELIKSPSGYYVVVANNNAALQLFKTK